jgi:hypothetical protein
MLKNIEIKMKSITGLLTVLILTGCLASTNSSVGVACDYRQEVPMYDMPLACQGR